MKNIGLNELRSMFREFYQKKEHYARKSFSLVPETDKSLLVINSGMAPLKPYFAGLETPPSKRMTTCQKCIRTGDLDNVGFTARHGTFFEMLGSFSFGDYFKRESLLWGWEFMTEVLEMPIDKLWASIYVDDDEAYDIWVNDVKISPDRIVRMGKEDNFWEIGTGPCGPCSEVYFDRGDEFGCGSPDCKPGCECDRYVEFWNHVFTQYNRDDAGNYTPLEHKNIDTGMGLERLACIMQGTDSIFDVDTIRTILDEICAISSVEYEEGKKRTDVSIRIITDHIRSVVFMLGDGITPSNEGRGYVLRRLLRRAVVHGKKLGIQGLFLHELADKVIEVSGHEYNEILEKSSYIKNLIRLEEERFATTIDQGLELLQTHISKLKNIHAAVLAGEDVFKLYDTYGVNPELTREVLSEEGLSIDEEGFLAELHKQQENSRKGQKLSDDDAWRVNEEVFKECTETIFVGYDALLENCSVNLIVLDGLSVEGVKENDMAYIVLDKTPFYAESGGQVSDIGKFIWDGGEAEVLAASHSGPVIVHSVLVKSGAIKVGDVLTASVDVKMRNRTARNHTATHLLQKALVLTLGEHIKQAGSYVSPELLRFDFTHFEGIGQDKIKEIEDIVNNVIDEFKPVIISETTLAEAKERGAAAFFDEKYGDKVRLVDVDDFSMELCGGTHIKNSGEIGSFKIISESSIGSGTRRIEAITGTNMVAPLVNAENTINELTTLFKTTKELLREKAFTFLDEMRLARHELEAAKKEQSKDLVSELLENAQNGGAIRLVTGVFDDLDINGLRDLSDGLKAAASGLVNVLISKEGGKVTIITSVSDDLLDKGIHAGKLVKELATAGGGGGGGKADMAQAGTKDPSKIPDIIEVAEQYFKSLDT